MLNDRLIKVKKGDQDSNIKINFFIMIDFEKMILPLVHTKHAAYYFIRLDSISEINGHDWLLVNYIPDEANV